ncbi:MAG: fibronectin type III domain-containing protein, partial [Pseudorhodobacter sp.]|nr:fibronectin type III domain-containing protein [Frankiaceae bacterium]
STALLASALSLPSAHAATAVTGPDVSSWQHPYDVAIDWTKVRAAGHSFAVVKASEGSYVNNWLARDTAGARAAHLVTGGYHFARPALPVSTAADQARALVSALGPQRPAGTLPPVLDLEDSGGLVPRDLVTWTQVFLETVRSLTGRTPILYTYRYFWSSSMAGSTAFSRYPLWLAAYSPTAPAAVGGSAAWSLWQYTSSGAVPGIRGGVDISRFAGTPAQFAALADGTARTAWPLLPPQAPVSTWGAAGDRSATVRWIPGDDGGQLPASWTVTASPGGATRTVAGSLTRTTFTGLTPGVAYSFTVRAQSAFGSSTLTWPSSPVVPGRTPATPTGLAAVATPHSVALGWAGSAGFPSRWTVSRCSGTPCTGWRDLATTTTRSWVDASALPGQRYGYRVLARNGYGASSPSIALGVLTPPAPIVAPRPPVVPAPPVVTATLTAGAVPLGQSVVLAGRTSRAAVGARVLRQGYYSGAWHTWAVAVVQSTGGFRFVVRPTVAATNRYRVVLPAAAWHRAVASPTLLLRVG